jgi:hypothetical protein
LFTINEDEIVEGLEIVKRQLQNRTRSGEEEYFKSKAKRKRFNQK